MKNYLYAILGFSLIFLLNSCRDDDGPLEQTTSMELAFAPTYGGDPVAQDIVFPYDDYSIKFSQVDFYISDVVLLKEDTEEEVELIELDFIDLSEGETIISTRKVPIGTYSGIRIGIGVTADQNRLSPTDPDISSNSPLSKSSHYWENWESYIFTKIEGSIDVDGDSFFEKNFAYHTGSDDLYRTKTLVKDITLNIDNTMKLNFNLDLKRIFFDEVSYFDIQGNPIINDDPENGSLNKFVENIMASITLQ